MSQQEPDATNNPYAYEADASQPSGQGQPPQQPYAAQPQQPYPPQQYGYQGQPYPGQAYPSGMAAPYRRPTWKTVLAVICFVIAGLFLLGSLSTIAGGGTSSDGDAARSAGYVVGLIIGALLFIGGPALIGWLLIRKPKAYR